MLGTIVNFFAIVFGATLGLLFGRFFTDKIRDTVIQGIGLVILAIGLQMALKTDNFLIVIGSIVLGAIIGEIIDIEARIKGLGEFLEKKIAVKGDGKFTKAFVMASLIYCVGSMAILGPLEDGLNGNHSILYVKSMLDGITSIFLAGSMGIGILFSALPVFIYQGLIALSANLLKGVLVPEIITEMSAVGGLMIFAIGINILGIKELRVGNYLPALIIVIPLAMIAGRF